MKPFFISIPHSGERIAPETPWLNGLPEPVLMCDPDRYVDVLYKDVIDDLQVPSIVTEWHRYVVDLNRFPEDIDQASVVGASNPVGTHPKGFHWSVTTKGDTLIPQPMPMDVHRQLTKKYYQSFHNAVDGKYREIFRQGARRVFQLDCHSMPSMGEKLHRDPGQRRPEVVISDCLGKSCDEDYKELVIESYEMAGFQVAYNWPYLGGRITERYGRPNIGQNAIQVELNRDLYMDEMTKKLKPAESKKVSEKLSQAVERIYNKIATL